MLQSHSKLSSANQRSPRVAVIVEGTIGDSLILVPSLRMIEKYYTGTAVEIVSFTNSPSISAGAILADTFPEFKFSNIDNSADRGVLGRLTAWVKLARYVRRHKIKQVIYGFRSETKTSGARAKLHRRILSLLSSATLVGFEIKRWPSKTGVIPQNQIARLMFSRLSEALGERTAFEDFSHGVRLSNSDRLAGEAWLRQHGVCQQSTYVAVCVTAKEPVQRWEISRYVDVLQKLNEANQVVPVFIGAPDDAKLHNEFISSLGLGWTAAGLPLGQAAAIIQGAAFYLGNDTGPMHLAAGLGRPCVVVQSARWHPGAWDPLGSGHFVHKYSPECAGCGLSVCPLEVQVCLSNISPKSVLESCKKVLASETISEKI